MSVPFQTTPLRSPDANLFSNPAVSLERATPSCTVGITGSASFASAPHIASITGSASFASAPYTARHPPFFPSGDSTVSSATADTILQPDFASF